MSDTRAWEVDTCRGHFNNVSSALFHPRHELIVSNGEDKTIRVWDMGKRTAVGTFRRENDRFWVLTAHPALNLFAAGHDNGLIVFKLDRERPAHAVHQNQLFYVRDKQVRQLDYSTGADHAVLSVKRLGSQYVQPRSLSFNPAERSVIVTSVNGEGGLYDLAPLPKEGAAPSELAESTSVGKRGNASSAIFVARNRLATLDKTAQTIEVRDLNNSVTKTMACPTVVSDIFFGGTASLLLATATGVSLFDIQQQKVIAEVNSPLVKYVVWSADGSRVALLSKHSITLADQTLSKTSIIHETIRLKSAAWDEAGVLVYSTLNHIKYALPNGDSGIIKTLDQPVYLTRVKGKTVSCLDRSAKPRNIAIDPTEYRFKLALTQGDHEEVMRIIKNSNLVGQAIIGYLQKKGYPEIALHFVQDRSTRFDLAIECGNLDVALETAEAISAKEVWERLGTAALKQGNHKIVERCYQKTRDFQRLSFLYLITGNKEKLAKMAGIAEKRGDPMSRFHNALYLGDASSRGKVLSEVGLDALAYITAKNNGNEDEAARIASRAASNGSLSEEELIQNVGTSASGASPLKPPPVVTKGYQYNWPLVGTTESYFDKALVADVEDGGTIFKDNAVNGGHDADGWLDGDDFVDAEEAEDEISGYGAATSGTIAVEGGDEEAWDLEDGEMPVDEADVSVVARLADHAALEDSLDPGSSEAEHWLRNSPIAADHAAAGSFDTAMTLLSRQAGIVDFNPLKPFFLSAYQGSRAYLPGAGAGSLPPVEIFLRRNIDEEEISHSLPAHARSVKDITQGELQEAYRAVNTNKLEDAEGIFRSILWKLVMTVGKDAVEGQEILDLIILCREYLLGVGIELARRQHALSHPEDLARQLELAALFTHAQMQPPHQQLALRTAMNESKKHGNLKTAAHFAQRLLNLQPPPSAKVEQIARAVLTAADRNPRDAVPVPGYDAHERDYVICAGSLVLIPAGGQGAIEDPLTGAKYLPEFRGTRCKISQISEVGKVGSGLRTWA